MHAYRAGQTAARTRVLYFFRSPSNIKVGRTPLDAEVIEALEHTHPDLAFDWAGMMREPGAPGRPFEPPDGYRAERQVRRPARASGVPPAEAPALSLEDESLLGRTIGAREAARLRGRYSELVQRIIRRAPTPEERDRLTDRLVRLNPDEWPDEAAIRSMATTVEAEWSALAEELPRRRRGRRGGRRSDREAASSPAGTIEPGAGMASAENEGTEYEADELGVDSGAGGPHNGRGDGAEDGGPAASVAVAGATLPDDH